MAIKPKPVARPDMPGATSPVPSMEGYFEITLSRAGDLNGHLYRPGRKIVVNQATLDAMGDAVLTKVALK
jgi:hypothetical protein